MWRLFLASTALSLVAIACISPDPDVRGWRCFKPEDCGASSKFTCLNTTCRVICSAQSDCTGGEICVGSVCLPSCVEGTKCTEFVAERPSIPDASTEPVTSADSSNEVLGEQAKETPGEPRPEPAPGEPRQEPTLPDLTTQEKPAERGCVSTEEVCNGVDDDCDGNADEEFPENGTFCSVPNVKGPCTRGVWTCQAGKLVCKQIVYPKNEVCGDGVDNNCNGNIDESPPCVCRIGDARPCFSGNVSHLNVGICKAGQQTCQSDGTWGACRGEVLPSSEVCDGKDNDCNGTVDEGCTCAYLGKAKGVCKNARRDKAGACVKPPSYAVREKCGDSVDNDCDGLVDEFGAGAQCYSVVSKCIHTGVSPSGPQDTCVVMNPNCSGGLESCPSVTFGGLCTKAPNVLPCQDQAACDACHKAVGGALFYCHVAKGICIRRSQ